MTKCNVVSLMESVSGKRTLGRNQGNLNIQTLLNNDVSMFQLNLVYHINLKLMYYLKMFRGELVYLDGNKDFYSLIHSFL